MLHTLSFVIAVAIAAPAAADPSSPPEGREALAAFAGCIAKASPDKVHSALTRDFTTSAYRSELKALSVINRDCLSDWEGLQKSRRVELRAGGLPFAAALAEAMLKRDEAPLNVRLLRAAPIEAPTYAPSDKVAMCVARSNADNVAALLTAPIATEVEATAARALTPAIRLCAQGTTMVVEPFGLRSILATASYRLLAAAEARP